MVQFVGIPFAFLFGSLGSRIGTKRCIFIAIGVYSLATILAFFMTSVVHFFMLAFMIATVQGGAQALSRALFSRLIPRDRSSEFFGFFAVAERFATVFGPAIFTISVMLTGSSQLGDPGDSRPVRRRRMGAEHGRRGRRDARSRIDK